MYQNLRSTVAADADILRGDVALFDQVEAGRADHLCRIWHTSHPVVVAGRHRRLDDDVVEDACRADGVPVIHRHSGGGTVVLGPGSLNYAVALSVVAQPDLMDVFASFRRILDTIVDALDVPGLRREGTDLALLGQKVSGNAQRRGRRTLLHHGTLLFAFDSRLAQRYLKEPDRQPRYRAGRRHSEFLANLPLAEAELRVRLERALHALGDPVGAPSGRGHNGANPPMEVPCP